MKQNIELLKEVLSIPTKTFNEKHMIEYLADYLTKNNYEYYIDIYSNIYVTKGVIGENEYYPCVIAHTDTVHDIDKINIIEFEGMNGQGQPKLALKAVNDKKKPTGIGGDDKCGVFACLEVLKELPVIKAAFFVSEEQGCIGSKNADAKFFSNVGYAIQFDSPGNNAITEFLMGKKMFSRESDFFKKCNKIVLENFTSDTQYKYHPYTDIYCINMLFHIECMNLPIGYYNYHTKHEYVIIEDVFNGIKSGLQMIKDLGLTKFRLISDNSKNTMII